MFENLVEELDELTLEELEDCNVAERRQEKATDKAHAPLSW